METQIKNYLGISIILGIVFLNIAIFWYVSSFSKSIEQNRIFQVSGEGKVIAVPDVAKVSFQVLTEGGKNLIELQKQNSEKANKIIAFLKEKGIEEKDIKTEFYNISPRYQYYSCPTPKEEEEILPCPPPEIVGYSVNQGIVATIRELNKVGEILTSVVEMGATSISALTFTIDDPTKLQNQARKEAITNAQEKAKTTAITAGFKLGKLISITEAIYMPSSIPYAEKFIGPAGGDISPQIEPGSQEIRINVSITYEIK